MPRVQVYSSSGSVQSIELVGTHVTVGRQADNLVALPDDPLVSRHHAAFERRDGHWWAVDLGSHNGTAVDGRSIDGPHPLVEQSRVLVGRTELVVVDLERDAGTTVTNRARPDPAVHTLLSAREREVVAFVAAGLTDDQIGKKLSISTRTVRSHLDRIRDKTGRRRRPELARLAHELESRTKSPQPNARSAVKVVLFTDIEQHTEMMRQLGDADGRVVLSAHEELVRGVLARHGGIEIKTFGDGFLASFDSPQRALSCAVELQHTTRAHETPGWGGVRIRIGINAGEPILENDDLYGTTVIVASRIVGLARGGQTLVSNVLKELVAGKGFTFSDQGNAMLRGFDEEIRLWELCAGESAPSIGESGAPPSSPGPDTRTRV